ncbi:MAG: phage tail protein [Spirochaetia bacterium]|nr:phage tail protein [Spirochaetia bacterium]
MQQTNPGQFIQSIKQSFFKGVAFGAGILATSLFAAAAAMNVFSSGQTISASQINQNFAISAPEGAVVAFYLAACPEGWAPADGTNSTPDLRGQFVRGRDDIGTGPAGTDPAGSRAIGNTQLDAFQGHRHNVSHNTGANTGIAAPGGGGADAPNGVINILDPITDGSNGPPRTANETRPKNVALTYCMRKN